MTSSDYGIPAGSRTPTIYSNAGLITVRAEICIMAPLIVIDLLVFVGYWGVGCPVRDQGQWAQVRPHSRRAQ